MKSAKLSLVTVPVLALFLAGCLPQNETVVVVADPAPTCGAQNYQGLVGTRISALDRSTIKAPLRVLAPDGIMTMDYRGDRMNISHTKAGVIDKVTCG